MKEAQCCGLFRGKVSSGDTPSSYISYSDKGHERFKRQCHNHELYNDRLLLTVFARVRGLITPSGSRRRLVNMDFQQARLLFCTHSNEPSRVVCRHHLHVTVITRSRTERNLRRDI